MIARSRTHKTFRHSTFCRTIALVQLLVLLLLAVPAQSYQVALEQGASHACFSAGSSTADHDECPCCPGKNSSSEDKNDPDSCSTCSYCSFFTPLTSATRVVYAPSVTALVSHEPLARLLDVHIPIFHPPQNHA